MARLLYPASATTGNDPDLLFFRKVLTPCKLSVAYSKYQEVVRRDLNPQLPFRVTRFTVWLVYQFPHLQHEQHNIAGEGIEPPTSSLLRSPLNDLNEAGKLPLLYPASANTPIRTGVFGSSIQRLYQLSYEGIKNN